MVYCWNCYKDHTGVTCRNFQQWLKENSSGEILFQEYIKKYHLKRCPNCNFYIEKISGCDNVTCGKCQKYVNLSNIPVI